MARSRQQSVELTFFVGKGGVGKTTTSAAYAAWLAANAPRRRILLLSTDPAHSLADVLQMKLGNTPKRISKNLSVWQIDAAKRFQQFIAEHREQMLEVIEQGTIFRRAEIEPFLDTALPGMSEMAALLALIDLLDSAEYERVVVDTAPFGHTLRLFQLPEQFQKLLAFLDAAMRRDQTLAAHFGGRVAQPGNAFVGEWQEMFARVTAMLASRATEIMLVTSAEAFALEQSVRVREHLDALKLPLTGIVLNRVVTSSRACPKCKRLATEAKRAQRFLGREFSKLPIYIGEDLGFPILGVEALAGFGANVFGGANRRIRTAVPLPTVVPRLTETSWPSASQKISFTLGKGGVGKTTISAGIAYSARKQKHAVIICSTDPSPSLDEVFGQPVGNEPVAVLGDNRFHAIEVDSLAEYQTFTARLRRSLDRSLRVERGGVHVELSHELDVLNALLDIMPPGVDELLGILRITRLVQDDRARVVIDMAPTGHALELLRMPERMLHWSRLLMKVLAAHRDLAVAQDVAVEVAGLAQDVRGLLGLLRDREQCAVFPVMLAEPLPDQETRRLLAELDGLQLRPAAIFVNRVHFSSSNARKCAWCDTAAKWQHATLAKLGRASGKQTIYAVRDFAEEISGEDGLRKLTSELWQLSAGSKERDPRRPRPGARER
jgi:arsenite-transporting ATPase